MNLNELDNSATDSDSGHSIDPKAQEHHQISSQEASNLPSIPFDPEWVSPFTLPPLPALRKSRGQSNILRSPEERLHQRSSSSAYYAAAWGSPYATPSPNRSPPQQRLRRRSQDLETASPLSARIREFTPDTTRIENKYREPSIVLPATTSARRRASSWDRSKSLSEKFNWLSESDLSGGEADIRIEKTPTRDTYLKSLKASVDGVKVPRTRPHQVQESVATITPDNFNVTDDKLESFENDLEASQAGMEQGTSENMEPRPFSDSMEKPLPRLPALNATEKRNEIGAIATDPDSPSRPRMQSLTSYQRPKRKVPWKGKTCIIALPLTDRESAGLPPPMSLSEIRERAQKWIAAGYNKEDLMFSTFRHNATGLVQSRSLFPDPQDMYAERRIGKLQVHIPDQSEWDAWVEYLKEEKLRALGVTPSNSEPPLSVQSPFSSTLSRVSSTFPSVAASPPITSFSANANPVRIAGNTFSPPLGRPGMGSRNGSHMASPSISGYPGPMHGYKQSIAQPRMTSPYDYPVSHPGSYGQVMRHTPNGYGPRQFSPPTAPNLQSLGQVLSPLISTLPSNDNGYGFPQQPTMEQIRQQQQRQQQLHQHMMQHQRQYSYIPPPQSRSADHLPRTPVLESPSGHTPEIMHPTPRSHRHNLSAALQRGVDDAEAARDGPKFVLQQSKKQTEALEVEKKMAESVAEEEQEPELPVLKRPETLADGDDRSDIETNPSIAASPLLVDKTNPFAAPFTNLQQIQDALQPQSQHKPKPSVSNLNVEAPVFDPQARFASSNFSFGGQSFQPSGPAATKPLLGGSRPSFASKNLSFSKLNIDAPAFTPSFAMQSTPTKNLVPTKDTPASQSAATPSKSPFTFSSPAFNVDAPEFKPGQSFSFTANSEPVPYGYQPSTTHAGSIFGNVSIDPSSRVNRRSAKVLPIVQPQSDESSGSQSEYESMSESAEDDSDDSGRPRAPSDRQKRARRVGDENDDELLFASSAPFDHAEGLSSKNEAPLHELKGDDTLASDNTETLASELDANSHADSEIKDAIGDGIPEPIARVKGGETNQIGAHSESEPLQKQDEVTKHTSEIDNSREELAASTQESSEPTSNPTAPIVDAEPASTIDRVGDAVTEKIKQQETASLDKSEPSNTEEQISEEQQAMDTAVSLSGHKSNFSLSALAKPFEFRPGQSFVPETVPTKEKGSNTKGKSGLMASRFATASPELQPAAPTGRDVSPPQKLHEYANPENFKPEDALPRKPLSPQEALRGESPVLQLPEVRAEPSYQQMPSIEESTRDEIPERVLERGPSENSRVDDSMPSYEEIDAVMRHLDDNPELGVERDDTPVKPTPLIDMRFPPAFRSDAPSPSPRRIVLGPQGRADWGLGIHKLNDGNEEVSDWNHEFSPRQEDKLQSQAQYFDSRVNRLVGNVLEGRLVPLEDALLTIQNSLATLLSKKSGRGGQRSTSVEKAADSDADDEDEYEAFEAFSTYRSHSPSRNQRRAEKTKAVVTDAMAANRQPALETSATDMTRIHDILSEMQKQSFKTASIAPSTQPDVRTVMEDVISSHPHFQKLRKQEDHEALQETYRSRLATLESALKEAEKRVDEESSLRQRMKEDIQKLNEKLLETEASATAQREASEEARSTLALFSEERETYRTLESKHADVLENNKALEDTLAEYRATSEQFREDIRLERARNQDLIQRMRGLREELGEKFESRQDLRHQLDRLKERMAQVMHDVHAEQDEWHRKEHELTVNNKTIQAALDHEIRHREKVELELSTLDKEHKENLRVRSQHEQAQREISGMREAIDEMISENKEREDQTFKLERELAYAKESTAIEVSKATTKLETELAAARAMIEGLRVDSEVQTARLQTKLDGAELDLKEHKIQHAAVISGVHDTHRTTVDEISHKHEVTLQELHASHERKLNDLHDQHTRAIHNSTEDWHRLEHHLNEKLSINDDRARHLQTQVKDLEERLEISKSAARAAVEAATAKTVTNLPTPASSVMASPPQRLSGASLQLIRGSDIPEKISPQAMRESILVLQDQLQNREHTIEQLEAEIAAMDKDAPAKIKERDNEITLLRELLTVRADDLDEIIATLAQPNFDRESTKNAAIRLRANLLMEQQLKERAATMGGLTSALPSITALSNFAQSPRGLPMAAAAAWGNWRKARDYGLSTVSDIASNISQTPSKSNLGSPSSLLAGLMTPPSASQRTPPPSDANPLSPPTMRPLAAAAARKNSGLPLEARPLRTYSSQARTLSSRQVEKKRESLESTESNSSEDRKRHFQPQPDTPTTPLASRSIGSLDLGEDIDEDASPYNSSEHDNSESPAVSSKEAVTT